MHDTTIARWLEPTTFAAALGAGLLAGVFFTFSSFVMPALARLPPAQGVLAMQAINTAALRPALLGVLFGTGLACLVAGVATLFTWGAPGSAPRLAGAIVYVVGAIVVTGAFNVPRNEALGALAPDSTALVATWSRYLVEWTSWNHVRAAMSLTATALFVFALRAAASSGGP